MLDNLGQGAQPYARIDGASPLGQQGTYLTHGPGDGGAVHLEPAGQHVMRDSVAKMHERGQQPVDEHQPVLRARAHHPLALLGGEPGLVLCLPQRTHLGDELGEHIYRRSRDPSIADDRRTHHGPTPYDRSHASIA